MSVLATTIAATARLLPGAEHGIDDKGYTSHSWIWPEQAELIYGTLASIIRQSRLPRSAFDGAADHRNLPRVDH